MVAKIAKFLALARKLIPRTTTLSILKHVCFQDGNMMVTDLENTIIMNIGIKEKFTIPYTLLSKIMAQKPKTVEFDVDGNDIILGYDEKVLKFESLDANEFPVLPKMEEKEIDSWDTSLIKLIHSQRIYVSIDELKKALCGVYVNSNGSLETCATNGHILRVVKIISPRDSDYEMIIPPKTLEILSQAARQDITVYECENHLRFELSSDLNLVSRKITADYPNYKNVIPKDCPDLVEFNHKDFLRIVKSSKPFINKKTNLIEVNVKDGQLTILANNPKEKISWTGHIPVKTITGDGQCRFGFDALYLEKLLGNMDSGKMITWSHNGSESASLFSGDSLDDENKINLLMPIRLDERKDDE